MRITKFAHLLAVTSLSFILMPSALPQEPAQPAHSQPFALKPLGHNVYAAIDNPKDEAGANAGFLIGDDGVLVVDSFENPEAAKLMLVEIRKLTALPIKYVVNTHYHLDHVAGNGVFAKEGAVIVAHRNVRAWIHTENLKFFDKEIKPEQRAMVEGLVSPGLVYDTEIEIFLGSRRVLIHFFPGHTGGDTVVAIPDAQVVFCGDLFWRNTLPNLIDATTSQWISTLEKLAAGHPDATFVPGHGDVGNAADVKAFRVYLSDLRAMVTEPVKAGKSGDDLVTAVMPQLKEKYGKWNFFDDFAKTDILDAAAELRGDKKNPQPESADRPAGH
jgi:glyoxylase-like metal-dependent hydrolase (beta-lactamase superfamily II)